MSQAVPPFVEHQIEFRCGHAHPVLIPLMTEEAKERLIETFKLDLCDECEQRDAELGKQ